MKVRLIDELTLQRELFCQIQQNAIESGSIHYDSYKNWCLSGLEVEKAINDIFSKSGPFAPTIDPETLPIVQELRANIAIQEKIIKSHHNPHDTDQIVKLSLENSNLKKQLAEVTAERNFAVQTIFKWTGCPECRNWDSKDDWCKKYDREASCIDGCDYPEWRGIQEE